MSWFSGTSPPVEASVLFNGNETHPHEAMFCTYASIFEDATGYHRSSEAAVLSNIDGALTHHGQEINQIREQNDCSELILLEHEEIVNLDVANSSRTKRRKLKSKVWNEFTKYVGEDEKEWAMCKHCKNKFVGSSKSGTTHLKNHLERCQGKRIPSGGAERSTGTSDLTVPIIIKDKFVLGQELNHSKMVHILNVFEEEKKKLCKYFDKLSCRFSLAIEWLESTDYFFTVLHFIDDGWELKKKIIDFQRIEDDRGLSETLLHSLSVWNINKSICSMVRRYDEGKNEFNEINSWLGDQGSLFCGGQLLPVCSLQDFIDDYIWNGPKWTSDVSNQLWRIFLYINKTSSNEHKFKIAVDKAKSLDKKMPSQGLPIGSICGDQFKILETAVEFKEAFFELELIDPSFESITLTKEGWDKATTLYECWKVLKDAIGSLSNSTETTLNVYFPKFCELHLKLLQWEKSDNYHAREIASSVREGYFDVFWNNTNFLLVIAAILDPRFKMDSVEHWYKQIYGNTVDSYLNQVIANVINVFNAYAKCCSNSETSGNYGNASSSTADKMLDATGSSYASSQHADGGASPLSELIRYLEDSKFLWIEEFDILGWWRVNTPNFPTLGRMARDFLAIPIASSYPVSSSSAQAEIFDILCCGSLPSDIKQALICTKIWLYSSRK